MSLSTERVVVEIPPYDGVFDFSFGPVSGYLYRQGDRLSCPMLVCSTPGKGWGGRAIVALEQAARQNGVQLVFVNVLNRLLREMLQRRGYTLTWEWDEQYGEYVDVWVSPDAGGGRTF